MSLKTRRRKRARLKARAKQIVLLTNGVGPLVAALMPQRGLLSEVLIKLNKK
jgi:hypothetical protein